MKRILTGSLAVMLCLLLTACNASAPPSSPPPDGSSEPNINTTTPVSDKATWPNGDVTLYVPARAGGGTDMVARLYADALNKVTGANFIVVNDTTGANSVAYETVRNANPDGLTLMIYHSGLCSQHAFGQYAHGLDEFTVISTLTKEDPSGMALLVSSDSQFETFEDLVTYACENPGTVTVGVETNGGDHLGHTLLEKQTGIQCSIVSAGSNMDKIPLILGGNLDVMYTGLSQVEDYLKAGSMRALVLFGTERSKLVPDVPTLEELGYESIVFPANMFLAGPIGIPPEISEAISSSLEATGKDAALVEGLEKLQLPWDYKSLEDAKTFAEDVQNLFDITVAEMPH